MASHQPFAGAGLSFVKELTAIRLDGVAAALREGRPGSIAAIALDSGFADISGFSPRFRQRFATTPGSLRRAG